MKMRSKKSNIGRRTRNAKSVYNRRLKLKKEDAPVPNHRDDKSKENRTEELEGNSSQARYAPASEGSTMKENQAGRGSNEILNCIRSALRRAKNVQTDEGHTNVIAEKSMQHKRLIMARSKEEHEWNNRKDAGEKWKKTGNTVTEGDANQSTAYIIKVIPRASDIPSVTSEPVYSGMVDTYEQFIDEGVQDKEECIIKNEESESNSSVIAMDANHSNASFNEETFRVLDPWEFPKLHLVGASEEKYLDKPIQYDHTYCREYDEKCQVKSEIVDIEEGVKSEEIESSSSVDANQSLASFNEEMLMLDPTSIKSEPVHWEQSEFPKCHLDGVAEEKNVDKPTQYDHMNCRKDDENWHVKSEVVEIPQQEYIMKNEETNPNSLVMEGHANHDQLPASSTEETPMNICDLGSRVNSSINCAFCEYIARSKHQLQMHIDFDHLNIKEHKCHLCEFVTSTDDISRHVKIKKHECHVCQYATDNITALRSHVDVVHLNIKKHKCHLCDYVAGRKSGLKSHVNYVHLRIKRHKCDLCKYFTTRKEHLDRHIDFVHSRNTNFVDGSLV